MIAPVKNATISVVEFGGELVVKWELPDVLPQNYKVYVFKRSKTDVSQAEIDSYFANINDLSSFNYNGLFVFDSFDANSDLTSLSDLTVLNEVEYYYKIVVRDEASGEYSDAVGVSAMPKPSLKLSVKDGKEIVYKALEKMLDNIYVTPSKKVQLGKDIKIINHFAIEPVSNNYIMLERVNGATYYKFWANEIATIKNMGQIKGDIDVDVIRATFITMDTPERRDSFAKIIRANKQVLIRLCKKLGAINCDINIEGDYYNPQIHGLNATGITIIFNLLVENQTLIPQEQLFAMIGEIKVEN